MGLAWGLPILVLRDPSRKVEVCSLATHRGERIMDVHRTGFGGHGSSDAFQLSEAMSFQNSIHSRNIHFHVALSQGKTHCLQTGLDVA